MRYLIVVAAVLLLVGCTSVALHAKADGAAQFDTNATYFAARADGTAHVALFAGGLLVKEYVLSEGEQKAWLRVGSNPFKKGSWQEVPYQDAMIAIYPPTGIPPAHTTAVSP